MKRIAQILVGCVMALAVASDPAVHAQVDDGAIRLKPRTDHSETIKLNPTASNDDGEGDGRRAFDYVRFENRLQSLWFQRKALLAKGRYADAAANADLIRAFCAEEGIGRLQGLSDALLVEADRFLDRGQHAEALSSLDLAERFDPGRPQIRFARARAYWQSGQGILASAGQVLSGLRAVVVRSIADFSLVNQVGLAAVVAIMAAVLLFSVLMFVRYHVAFRHEIEETCLRSGRASWGLVAGWLLLLLPLLLWVGAGWVALFWIVILFRFMRRPERLAAVALILATALAIPAFRVSVAFYGMTTDPEVRTTLEASSGPYSPERVVKLQKLVAAHPDDATYRFLLAGLYKNGRYFESAFEEYKQALALAPSLYQAYVNIGNIYHQTGQYTEAVANYLRALEIRPDSVLALYNMHVSQAESFRFKESRESLDRARRVDPERIDALMVREEDEGGRALVVDATVELGSVWRAAFEGGDMEETLTEPFEGAGLAELPTHLLNPVTAGAGVALLGCFAMMWFGGPRSSSRRCIRCGRPFCNWCKSSREGHEYCSQCLHLFVIGDGLAPETKQRKMYLVERYERRTRIGRRIVGLFVPGSRQLLRGRVLGGLVLVVLWFAALVAWRPALLQPFASFLGLDLRLDLLRAGEVPGVFHIDAWTIVGLVTAVTVWIVANLGTLRRREA